MTTTRVSEPPRPPSALDARLIQHYPLRGLVLCESGSARVQFTVDPLGMVTTGEWLQATGPEYIAACRRMLEGTIWTPARTSGKPVSFTSAFNCQFEYAGANGTRTVTPPTMATPAVQPDYGSRWWSRYADTFANHGASADLNFTVGANGQVHVDSMVEGGDSGVADACTRLLELGPPWQPATGTSGDPIVYRGVFKCRLEVIGSATRRELYVGEVGTLGPIEPKQVALVVADRFQDLIRCFDAAWHSRQPVVGRLWIAFEIRPEGDVGRVEWVEHPPGDPALDACLIDALHRWRFQAAPQRTIADMQLHVRQK